MASLERLLLVTAHRLGVETDAALCFDRVSTMGLLALLLILEEPRVDSAKSLAAALGSARSSASELVDRLVRDGLVERLVDSADRRGRILVATELGARVGRNAREAVAICMESLTSTFSDQEKETLRELLSRLEINADWHRARRYWGLHGIGGPCAPKRRPSIHVR